MRPVKSKKSCFVSTIVPFLFLILPPRSCLFLFWCSYIISLSIDFSVSAIFPHNMHHSITFTVREDVRACLSLYTTPSIPHPSFPLSFPIQFLFHCLIRAAAGCSRRQVEISWQTSFSADKYLAWLRKTHTHISLSNQLFPLLFFLSYPVILRRWEPLFLPLRLLLLLAGPQGPHWGNGIIWAQITTCVSISCATRWQRYRLVCTPLYFVTRGHCVRAKRLWEPLMKSTCSPV